MSDRFACRVTGQNRSTQRHEAADATPADLEAGLRIWLHKYAEDHPGGQYGNRCAFRQDNSARSLPRRKWAIR